MQRLVPAVNGNEACDGQMQAIPVWTSAQCVFKRAMQKMHLECPAYMTGSIRQHAVSVKVWLRIP